MRHSCLLPPFLNPASKNLSLSPQEIEKSVEGCKNLRQVGSKFKDEIFTNCNRIASLPNDRKLWNEADLILHGAQYTSFWVNRLKKDFLDPKSESRPFIKVNRAFRTIDIIEQRIAEIKPKAEEILAKNSQELLNLDANSVTNLRTMFKRQQKSLVDTLTNIIELYTEWDCALKKNEPIHGTNWIIVKREEVNGKLEEIQISKFGSTDLSSEQVFHSWPAARVAYAALVNPEFLPLSFIDSKSNFPVIFFETVLNQRIFEKKQVLYSQIQALRKAIQADIKLRNSDLIRQINNFLRPVVEEVQTKRARIERPTQTDSANNCIQYTARVQAPEPVISQPMNSSSLGNGGVGAILSIVAGAGMAFALNKLQTSAIARPESHVEETSAPAAGSGSASDPTAGAGPATGPSDNNDS